MEGFFTKGSHMTTDWQALRIEGIYRQPHEGFAMQRIKLPAGLLSAEQAHGVAAIAGEFARSELHLTTRGSIEFHWVSTENLGKVKSRLAALGLTSRGACGGAVRGVTCAGRGGVGFPLMETVARRLQQQFTGNPRFERLPKKFKIGIFTQECDRSHLIQDVGLVAKPGDQGSSNYDVWIGGGLGREPQAGFLLEERVTQGRLIPLIEAVLQVYGAHAAAGKRLKHVVRELGEERLRELIMAEPSATEELSPPAGLPDSFLPGDPAPALEAPLFAGELSADTLARLAEFSRIHGGGWMVVTPDQNITFRIPGDVEAASQELLRLGFGGMEKEEQVSFRICPGSHECRMGLTPTRDVARQVIAAMGTVAGALRWAISGCLNSCAQPQLADQGIAVSGLVKGDDGSRSPRFDLYRLPSEGLGLPAARNLTLEELLAQVRELG